MTRWVASRGLCLRCFLLLSAISQRDLVDCMLLFNFTPLFTAQERRRFPSELRRSNRFFPSTVQVLTASFHFLRLKLLVAANYTSESCRLLLPFRQPKSPAYCAIWRCPGDCISLRDRSDRWRILLRWIFMRNKLIFDNSALLILVYASFASFHCFIKFLHYFSSFANKIVNYDATFTHPHLNCIPWVIH